MWERVQEARQSDGDPTHPLSDEYLEGLQAAEDKLLKYFDLIKASTIYCASVALDPSVRLHWFDDKWGGYDEGSWLRTAKRQFCELYDQYATAIARDGSYSEPILIDDAEAPKSPDNEEDSYANFGGLSSTFLARKRKRAGSVSHKKDEQIRG